MTKDLDKKVTIAEVARSARKLQEEKDGERIISESSASALSEFAYKFEAQYKESQARAGSAKKVRVGIMAATEKILAESPHLTAQEIWGELTRYKSTDPFDTDHGWGVFGDGGRLIQVNFRNDKLSAPMRQSTFETSYVRVARRKLKDS